MFSPFFVFFSTIKTEKIRFLSPSFQRNQIHTTQTTMPSTKEEIDSDSSFSSDSDEELGSTGLTQNQNRLLYLISLYTHLARTDDEKETWIRKPALMVLIYNANVKKTLDYDYAPASKLVEGRRKYFNISQRVVPMWTIFERRIHQRSQTRRRIFNR